MDMKSEIENIIENSHDEIVKTVQDQLKQEIISSLTYNFRDDISKIVSDYVKNNMTDDIKKILDIEKPNMLTEIQKSCTTIAAEIGKTMVETATKNISSSYDAEQIIKKIFN